MRRDDGSADSERVLANAERFDSMFVNEAADVSLRRKNDDDADADCLS